MFESRVESSHVGSGWVQRVRSRVKAITLVGLGFRVGIKVGGEGHVRSRSGVGVKSRVWVEGFRGCSGVLGRDRGSGPRA